MIFKTSIVSSLAVAGVTSLAAMVTPSAAMAGTFSYSGDLTGQPTFNRAGGGDPPTSLSSVGTAVPYQTQSFTVDTTGSGYEIIGRWRPNTGAPANANSSADGHIFLYQNSFDPLNPLTNIISGNDDFRSASLNCSVGEGCSRLTTNISNTLTLTAGVTYIVVASQFFNTSSPVTAYTVDINTPGNAQVIFPGATTVPEPASILGLLFVGGAGLLSKRQKSGKYSSRSIG